MFANTDPEKFEVEQKAREEGRKNIITRGEADPAPKAGPKVMDSEEA